MRDHAEDLPLKGDVKPARPRPNVAFDIALFAGVIVAVFFMALIVGLAINLIGGIPQ